MFDLSYELKSDAFVKQANKGIRPIYGASLHLYSSSIRIISRIPPY